MINVGGTHKGEHDEPDQALAISTITAVMILGSTIVFASTPAADTSGTSADQTSVSAELAPGPAKRGGGGSGKALKK